MAKRIMRSFKMTEISGVDNPAQAHARMTIMKRAELDPYWKRDFTQDQRDHAASTGAALPDGSFPIQNTSDLKNAIHAVGRASDPAKAKAHIISRAKSLGATDLLPDNWVGKSGGDADHTKESDMADTEKQVAELTKQIGELKTQLDAANEAVAKSKDVPARLEELTKQLEMLKAAAKKKPKSGDNSDAEDAADGGSDEAAEKKFNDAVAAEVTKQVAEAIAKRDEILKTDETIEVDGKVVRKSQSKDPEMWAVMKGMYEREQLNTFTKRAETEIGHLPGETTLKAKVLREVSKIADKDVREAATAMLKSGNAGILANMKAIGKDGSAEGGAQEKLQKRAEVWATDNKVEKSLAIAKFLETPEGQQLYADVEAEKRKSR